MGERSKKAGAVVKSFDRLEVESPMPKQIGEYISEFGVKYGFGIQAIAEAARIYVEALRSHPGVAAYEFEEAFKNRISRNTWKKLEMIGNRGLDPNAMLLPETAVRRIKLMDIDDQKRIFEKNSKGFQYYDARIGASRVVCLGEMSDSEAEMIFDRKDGHVRTPDEQKSLIVDLDENGRLKKTSRRSTRGVSYVVTGNVVRINNVELCRSMLVRILNEMDTQKRHVVAVRAKAGK